MSLPVVSFDSTEIPSMNTPVLDREEYIEQAYFFRTYRERLNENWPAQEILKTIHEEVLSTTKLPMALEFLSGEINLRGRISEGMQRLPHYFTAFQAFIVSRAEEDRSKFDLRTALEILERESQYRSESPSAAGLFIYQFECVARNRLGYEAGMLAMADDPHYDISWQDWIHKIRLQLGAVDFAELIYARSEYLLEELRRRSGDPEKQPPHPLLFGYREGRIAKANFGKDPLLMFAALQRQLGYPAVPRTARRPDKPDLHPALEQRLQRIEQTLQVLQQELKGGIDLSQFYVQPNDTET